MISLEKLEQMIAHYKQIGMDGNVKEVIKLAYMDGRISLEEYTTLRKHVNELMLLTCRHTS